LYFIKSSNRIKLLRGYDIGGAGRLSKIILSLIIMSIGCIMALSACINSNSSPQTTKLSATTSMSVPEVPFKNLLSEPEQYNGQTVNTEGIYIKGWEWSLLAESVVYQSSGANPGLSSIGQVIWFNGGLPVEEYEKIHSEDTPGAGRQYYCKVKIIGKFEYGGQYGNMGASKSQITTSKIEIVEWIPPK
jgi:hypothetical protein